MGLQFHFELVHNLERCAYVPETKLKAIYIYFFFFFFKKSLSSDCECCDAEWNVPNADDSVAAGRNIPVLPETVPHEVHWLG
jgi:hypothetical protein